MSGLAEGRPLRILHVPNDLGGHPRALAMAQRKLGHDAVCVSLSHSPLGFNGDESHDVPLGTPGRLLARERARFRLLWRSLAWADVIHCHFGQTLFSVRAQPIRDRSRAGFGETASVTYARALWLRDLALWRMAGKRVVMTFYGDDVRMVDLSVARNPHTHLALPGLHEEFARRDPWKRKLVTALARNGVTMFATNPDLLSGLPADAAFIPYGSVEPAMHQPEVSRATGTLRFIHMPTDRDVKGTSLFVAAIEQLRREGVDCSLALVEGVTNAQALATLREHDVLLDQLRVGWFGAVAVEAMAMGKPAVAYLHPDDKAKTPAAYAAMLPIIETSPELVADRLRAVAAMPRAELIGLGHQSRHFVETWHTPESVARTVLEAYRRP
jgi:glycosyltransferase involved in cell wall biosynthesis